MQNGFVDLFKDYIFIWLKKGRELHLWNCLASLEARKANSYFTAFYLNWNFVNSLFCCCSCCWWWWWWLGFGLVLVLFVSVSRYLGCMGTLQKSWEAWAECMELTLLFILSNLLTSIYSFLSLHRNSRAVLWEPAMLSTHSGNSPVLGHFLILRATQAV